MSNNLVLFASLFADEESRCISHAISEEFCMSSNHSAKDDNFELYLRNFGAWRKIIDDFHQTILLQVPKSSGWKRKKTSTIVKEYYRNFSKWNVIKRTSTCYISAWSSNFQTLMIYDKENNKLIDQILQLGEENLISIINNSSSCSKITQL